MSFIDRYYQNNQFVQIFGNQFQLVYQFNSKNIWLIEKFKNIGGFLHNKVRGFFNYGPNQKTMQESKDIYYVTNYYQMIVNQDSKRVQIQFYKNQQQIQRDFSWFEDVFNTIPFYHISIDQYKVEIVFQQKQRILYYQINTQNNLRQGPLYLDSILSKGFPQKNLISFDNFGLISIKFLNKNLQQGKYQLIQYDLINLNSSFQLNINQNEMYILPCIVLSDIINYQNIYINYQQLLKEQFQENNNQILPFLSNQKIIQFQGMIFNKFVIDTDLQQPTFLNNDFLYDYKQGKLVLYYLGSHQSIQKIIYSANIIDMFQREIPHIKNTKDFYLFSNYLILHGSNKLIFVQIPQLKYLELHLTKQFTKHQWRLISIIYLQLLKRFNQSQNIQTHFEQISDSIIQQLQIDKDQFQQIQGDIFITANAFISENNYQLQINYQQIYYNDAEINLLSLQKVDLIFPNKNSQFKFKIFQYFIFVQENNDINVSYRSQQQTQIKGARFINARVIGDDVCCFLTKEQDYIKLYCVKINYRSFLFFQYQQKVCQISNESSELKYEIGLQNNINSFLLITIIDYQSKQIYKFSTNLNTINYQETKGNQVHYYSQRKDYHKNLIINQDKDTQVFQLQKSKEYQIVTSQIHVKKSFMILQGETNLNKQNKDLDTISAFQLSNKNRKQFKQHFDD